MKKIKNLITLSLLLSLAFNCFSQENKNLYGPAPYRTLAETVGETYITIPSDIAKKFGYTTLYKGRNSHNGLSYKNGVLKSFKLVGFDYPYAVFTDSVGAKYYTISSEGILLDLAPQSDWENAKTLLVNHTFWLKNDRIMSPDGTKEISKLVNQPVMVTEVRLVGFYSTPIRVMLKTESGETGYIDLSLSGTNSDAKHSFYNFFSTEDPKIQAQKEANLEKRIDSLKEESNAKTRDMIKSLKNNPCSLIKEKTDDFENTKTIYTPLIPSDIEIEYFAKHSFISKHYNTVFYKAISKTKITYYLSLTTIGHIALATEEGVIIILKNGKRINKPNEKVKTDVNKDGDYERSAFIELTPADLMVLKTSPIDKFKLYVDSDTADEPDMIYKTFICLLSKK